MATKALARRGLVRAKDAFKIEAGEVYMSVIVPAYNEEQRLWGMLEEAVDYLQESYRDAVKASLNGNGRTNGHSITPRKGWEIIIVSDGSTDKTVETALRFVRTRSSSKDSMQNGQSNGTATHLSLAPGDTRIVTLEENRGKGGAVTHGMRHARGEYVVFADADGASKFSDLSKLVVACDRVKDKKGRAVGIGSRAHMVGTDAVVKVCRAQALNKPKLIHRIAVIAEKFAYARVPSAHPHTHNDKDGANQRHTVRV